MSKDSSIMPGYQSHKRVRASVITEIQTHGGKTTVYTESGYQYEATADWLRRIEPDKGDYLVQYSDGYMSACPAQTFVEGNRLVTLGEFADDTDDTDTDGDLYGSVIHELISKSGAAKQGTEALAFAQAAAVVAEASRHASIISHHHSLKG